MIDEKTRPQKIALSELKEAISTFLYKNYIDFERDKGIIINDVVLNPSFFLNKYNIIIDCFVVAEDGQEDFDKNISLYRADNVKFIALDLRDHAKKNTEQLLRETLPKLGCSLQR